MRRTQMYGVPIERHIENDVVNVPIERHSRGQFRTCNGNRYTVTVEPPTEMPHVGHNVHLGDAMHAWSGGIRTVRDLVAVDLGTLRCATLPVASAAKSVGATPSAGVSSPETCRRNALELEDSCREKHHYRRWAKARMDVLAR